MDGKPEQEELGDAELDDVRGGEIDAGAVFKLQDANIDAGTLARAIPGKVTVHGWDYQAKEPIDD